MNLSQSSAVLAPLLIVGLVVAACSTASSSSPAPASPAPPASPAANASPTAPPALTETFVSPMNGISVGYPKGWTARAATEKWTTTDWGFDQPTVDIIYDPSMDDGHLFMSLGSQQLGATTADKWIADQMAFAECTTPVPITVDGASGSACGDKFAVVSKGDRGYMILLYTSGDEGWLDSVYDRAWFEKILATVKLNPAGAVDAAPSPSP